MRCLPDLCPADHFSPNKEITTVDSIPHANEHVVVKLVEDAELSNTAVFRRVIGHGNPDRLFRLSLQRHTPWVHRSDLTYDRRKQSTRFDLTLSTAKWGLLSPPRSASGFSPSSPHFNKSPGTRYTETILHSHGMELY